MADLVVNFSYATITSAVSPSDTVLTVDSAARIPSNTDLASADFYMTIESTLALGQFEIVRVTSKTASALTVVRGQEGTTAYSHAANTVIKGALTTGILSRVWPPVRTTKTYLTAPLTENQTEQGQIVLSKGYRLLAIQTSIPSRTRLYDTTSHQSGDLSRLIGVDPTGDHGLILEFVSTSTLLGATLSPLVDGFDGKSVPDGSIPITVTNKSQSTTAISVTFTYLRNE